MWVFQLFTGGITYDVEPSDLLKSVLADAQHCNCYGSDNIIILKWDTIMELQFSDL